MDDRLDELEIRYTLQQDVIAQLSDVVARHEKEIERLRSVLEQLRGKSEAAPLAFDPDEKPPHY